MILSRKEGRASVSISNTLWFCPMLTQGTSPQPPLCHYHVCTQPVGTNKSEGSRAISCSATQWGSRTFHSSFSFVHSACFYWALTMDSVMGREKCIKRTQSLPSRSSWFTGRKGQYLRTRTGVEQWMHGWKTGEGMISPSRLSRRNPECE